MASVLMSAREDGTTGELTDFGGLSVLDTVPCDDIYWIEDHERYPTRWIIVSIEVD